MFFSTEGFRLEPDRGIACMYGLVAPLSIHLLCSRFVCAMAPKRKLDEIGGVVDESGSFRVRMKLDGRGIEGPRRGNKLRALGDLNVIRAAAAESESREDGFEAVEDFATPAH